MSEIKLVPELENDHPQRKVYILSAIPGTGKSTQALLIVERFGNDNCTIVSADQYFMKFDPATGQSAYQFNARDLPKAHRRCKKLFLSCFEDLPSDQKRIVIVDNTNIQPVEAAFYYEYADLQGFEVEVVRFHVEPEVAFERQTHNVPKESFRRMHHSFRNAQWPRYWNVRNITL